MMFWKRQEKWHEVRWFDGPRDIYLALQFARDGDEPGNGEARPTVERLDSKDPKARSGQPPLDESQLVAEIEAAVVEYNRKNLCSLRVGAIRYRAKGGANAEDHGSAARKLLNLL